MGGTGVLRPECVSLVMNSAMTGGTVAAKRTYALTNAAVMDLNKEYVKAV